MARQFLPKVVHDIPQQGVDASPIGGFRFDVSQTGVYAARDSSLGPPYHISAIGKHSYKSFGD